MKKTGWGSVQYDSAASLFCHLQRDWDTALVSVHSKVHWTGERTDDQIVKLLQRKLPASSVEHFFVVAREKSWDLWTAAPYAAHSVFENLVVECDAAPGFGPPLNVKVQSQNYHTAIFCGLLVKLGHVSDTNVFANFDT